MLYVVGKVSGLGGWREDVRDGVGETWEVERGPRVVGEWGLLDAGKTSKGTAGSNRQGNSILRRDVCESCDTISSEKMESPDRLTYVHLPPSPQFV